MYSPMVIGVNGPPHSGKGWLIKKLQELIPDSFVLCVQDGIFDAFKSQGLAPEGVNTYQEYKAHADYSRALFIEFTESVRATHVNAFSSIVTARPEYRQHRVILYDNVGFYHELEWFEHHCNVLFLLRIECPYVKEGFRNDVLRQDATRRLTKGKWYRDSRGPVSFPIMLTAYDSLQMWHLLQWINGNLTREEAGAYYELKSIWDQFFRYTGDSGQQSFGDIPGFERNARQLVGLDSAAGRNTAVEGIRDNISSSGTSREVGRNQ